MFHLPLSITSLLLKIHAFYFCRNSHYSEFQLPNAFRPPPAYLQASNTCRLSRRTPVRHNKAAWGFRRSPHARSADPHCVLPSSSDSLPAKKQTTKPHLFFTDLQTPLPIQRHTLQTPRAEVRVTSYTWEIVAELANAVGSG